MAAMIEDRPCLSILLVPEELRLRNVHHFYIDTKPKPDNKAKAPVVLTDSKTREKKQIVADLYEALMKVNLGQSIIFMQTKSECDLVTEELKKNGYAVSKLHGNLQPTERDAVCARVCEARHQYCLVLCCRWRGSSGKAR